MKYNNTVASEEYAFYHLIYLLNFCHKAVAPVALTLIPSTQLPPRAHDFQQPAVEQIIDCIILTVHVHCCKYAQVQAKTITDNKLCVTTNKMLEILSNLSSKLFCLT